MVAKARGGFLSGFHRQRRLGSGLLTPGEVVKKKCARSMSTVSIDRKHWTVLMSVQDLQRSRVQLFRSGLHDQAREIQVSLRSKKRSLVFSLKSRFIRR